MPKYNEREITSPVNLCNDSGGLNRDAVGWSRVPMHTCNLSGNWPRKKKWNFWLVLNEKFGFSATIANVDYLGVGAVYVADFSKKSCVDGAVVIPRGRGVNMPERVEEDVRIDRKDIRLAFTHTPDTVRIEAYCPSLQGRRLEADITLSKPPDHETLNVVIPWSDSEFHFTSKQNTLPARGIVKLGDDTIEFRPEDAFGVLDFGRGIWPKTIKWNWLSLNHRQGDDLIGLNLGAKWTDGTGDNENGICLNGKLYKISEDIIFTYDTKNYMAPWRMKTEVTDTVDLTLTPIYDKGSGVNSNADSQKVVASSHQMFGHFNGMLKAGGRTVKVKDAFGWAEEHIGNW